MAKEIRRTLTGHCTLDGATLKTTLDGSEIATPLKEQLAKRLQKRQAGIAWGDGPDQCDFRIRFIEVEQGNQLLRYILPFIAPAAIEVEGEVLGTAQGPKAFHYRQRAQVGLFGGSAKSMLKGCAIRLADKIAKDIQRGLLET